MNERVRVNIFTNMHMFNISFRHKYVTSYPKLTICGKNGDDDY